MKKMVRLTSALAVLLCLCPLAFGDEQDTEPAVEDWHLRGTLREDKEYVDNKTHITVYTYHSIGNFQLVGYTVTHGDGTTEETFGIRKYTGPAGAVQIPATVNGKRVSTISEGAFKNKGLTEVTFPSGDSLIFIESEAFAGNRLTSLRLPDSVQEIDARAFANNRLATVKLPYRTLRTLIIGNEAFRNNQITNIEGFTLGGKLEIGDYAFADNKIVDTSFLLLIGVDKLGKYAFANNALTDIYISSPSISEGAFSNNKLTEVTLGYSVQTIGTKAFMNNAITSLSFASSEDSPAVVTKIEVDAFANNKLTELSLPESLTSLSGFAGNQITALDIPPQVKTIGDRAFTGNSLTEVFLPDTVSSIGTDAFKDNQLVEFPVMPDSVNAIGANAFTGNQFEALPNYAVSLTNRGGRRLAAITAYTGPGGAVSIPDALYGYPVYSIGANAFAKRSISKVVIPPGISSIGSQAFAEDPLESITIGSTVGLNGSFPRNFDAAYNSEHQRAGTYSCHAYRTYYSWYGAEKIRTLDGFKIAETVDGIVVLGYTGDTRDLYIPDSFGGIPVCGIAAGALAEMDLETVRLPRPLADLGPYAFYKNRLETIVIPGDLKRLGDSSFLENPVTRISLGSNVDLNKNFPPAFASYYNDCFKLAGTYYYGTMRKRWLGGIASPPKFLSGSGLGLEAVTSVPVTDLFTADGASPVDSASFALDNRLALGLNFDLFSFNISLMGTAGAKIGYKTVGVHGGGMGELYLHDGFGLGFGGGYHYFFFTPGTYQGFLNSDSRSYPYLRGEIIIRGMKQKLSIYGEYYMEQGWGLGLLWHNDNSSKRN